jgi:FMN reductase [NAD(P)H]
MNETIKVMKNHRSIRKYKNEMISDEIIENLIDVAQHAPNSINGQQSTIIVIKDKETKKKISEYAGGQPWIEECPVFLVFVMDFYKTKLACDKNQRTQTITESVESIMVGCVDIGLGMQNVITAAESLGLGTVCIGGIRNNPGEMIKILDLPEFTYPVVGLCLGYPEDYSALKPRMAKEAYCHMEKYNKEILSSAIDNYDKVIASYLAEGGREQKVNWSSSTSNSYQHVYFPKVYPTLKEQGFKNDK